MTAKMTAMALCVLVLAAVLGSVLGQRTIETGVVTTTYTIDIAAGTMTFEVSVDHFQGGGRKEEVLNGTRRRHASFLGGCASACAGVHSTQTALTPTTSHWHRFPQMSAATTGYVSIGFCPMPCNYHGGTFWRSLMLGTCSSARCFGVTPPSSE